MDYYPQPRPVLYGSREDESPAQTLTAPVRIGPPRYPPAPPLAGDAPEPLGPLLNIFLHHRELNTRPLALLYAAASFYSLLDIGFGITPFANLMVGRLILSGEIVIGLVFIATLLWHSGREYQLALGLVVLHIALGVVFAQWESPALWVAIVVMLYLLRPSVRKHYARIALLDISRGNTKYKCRQPCQTRLVRSESRSIPEDWRIRW